MSRYDEQDRKPGGSQQGPRPGRTRRLGRGPAGPQRRPEQPGRQQLRRLAPRGSPGNEHGAPGGQDDPRGQSEWSRPGGSPGGHQAGYFGGGKGGRFSAPGAEPGFGGSGRGQEHTQFDPDHHQWRSEQMRALDADYRQWREERYKRFSEEFSTWRQHRTRTARSGAEGTSGSSPEPGTGNPTGSSLGGETGKTGLSDSSVPPA